jgi:hypothetical protein
MKLLFLVAIIFSLPVSACPNLSGIYKICKSSNGQNSMASITIEQKIINKYNQYTLTIQESEDREVRIEKYTADGKTKVASDTDAETGITIRTETLTTCKDNVLNIKMNATLDAEAFANVTIKMTKLGNQLTQVFSGISMEEPINDTIVCE